MMHLGHIMHVYKLQLWFVAMHLLVLCESSFALQLWHTEIADVSLHAAASTVLFQNSQQGGNNLIAALSDAYCLWTTLLLPRSECNPEKVFMDVASCK